MSSQELGRGTWLGNTSWYENILVILTVFFFVLTYMVVLDFFNFVVFPAPKCSSALADLYIPWLWVPPTNSDWLEGIQSNITDSDLIISFIILFPVSSLISPDMRTLCWIWQFLLPLLASLILFYPLRSFHLSSLQMRSFFENSLSRFACFLSSQESVMPSICSLTRMK